jgi:hypothetical protein
MAARDYYDILGVKSDANDEEIKRREDEEKLEKEVRNGRQRQEGQRQGSETEDKQAGTKGEKQVTETTEKNPLTESMVRCLPQPVRSTSLCPLMDRQWRTVAPRWAFREDRGSNA